jgi:magnesium transporter
MLINCVAYQNGVKLAEPSIEDISEYLKQPGCLIWVALRDATDGKLDKMQEEFGLHDLAVEDARHGHQRPKIEEYGDTLFVVMHLVEVVHPDLTVGEISIFAGRNFILSVRERCQREPDLLRLGSGFVPWQRWCAQSLVNSLVVQYNPTNNMR